MARYAKDNTPHRLHVPRDCRHRIVRENSIGNDKLEELRMGEYIEKQIQNSAKIEATIGIGITTIITTFVIDSAVNGGSMPNWAMLVLGMLLATFFGIRILAYFRFVIEREMFMREKKADAEIQQAQLNSQIRKLEVQVKLKELGGE